MSDSAQLWRVSLDEAAEPADGEGLPAALQAALGSEQSVLIDARETKVCSFSALQHLVAFANSANEQSRETHWLGAESALATALSLAGMDGVLEWSTQSFPEAYALCESEVSTPEADMVAATDTGETADAKSVDGETNGDDGLIPVF